MEENALVQTAARIAASFNIDPMEVLNSDEFTWHVRVAAARVVAADMERMREEAKSGD